MNQRTCIWPVRANQLRHVKDGPKYTFVYLTGWVLKHTNTHTYTHFFILLVGIKKPAKCELGSHTEGSI